MAALIPDHPCIPGCRICWLADNDERYQALWGLPTTKTATPVKPVFDCVHLGNPTGELVACTEGCSGMLKVFACAVHGGCTIARHGLGVKAKCETCPDRVPITQAPPPPIRKPLKNMRRLNCAYGVTTCKARLHDLLPITLRSLAQAGFDKPRLFVDGVTHAEADKLERQHGTPVTSRATTPLKTFGNWFLALWELLIREPACEYYAIFQDDIVACRDLRAYLDNVQWPDKGYLNLYTFPMNQALAPCAASGRVGYGFYQAKEYERGPDYHGKKGQTGLGAVALCFTRDAVIDLLSSRHAVERPLSVAWSTAKVDGCIVTSMNKAGWREYVHDPSLVQHMGKHSTMGNQRHPDAPSFKGETWSALEMI